MPYNQKDAEQSLKRLFPEEYEKIQSNKSYYQRLNESKVGQALDWIDLGLDAASIIPGPIGAAAAVAGTVTGIPQGLLAIGDGFTKGWNVQNISDAAKILPGGAITGTIAKKGLAFLGKSDKYARRANPYFKKKSKTLLPDQESGIDMVRRDKKYLPYFLPTWGADAANIGTDIIHIQSNKIGGKVKKANARKWKHEEGGEINNKDVDKSSDKKSKKKLVVKRQINPTGMVNKRPIPGLLTNELVAQNTKKNETKK